MLHPPLSILHVGRDNQEQKQHLIPFSGLAQNLISEGEEIAGPACGKCMRAPNHAHLCQGSTENEMTGNLQKLPMLYLKPGEWYYGQEPFLITTVLGSCVAVTMFHRETRLAAMCHALMPSCEEKNGCKQLCEEFSRYTSCIIPRMAEIYFQKGIAAGNIEIKLFGGSHSLSINSRDSLKVGTRNIDHAITSIQQNGLRLVKWDVGGSKGRKLLFETDSGEVLMKRLNPNTDTGTGRFLIEQMTRGVVGRGNAA